MAEGGGDSWKGDSLNIPSDFFKMFTDNFTDNTTTGFMPIDLSIGDGLSTAAPYLEILEQPKQRGFRFRYCCEGPSHGGLPGDRSEKGKKSYPSVQINNYVGVARIEVSLVTATDPAKPHAHSLVGKNVRDGAYLTEVGPEQSMTACFPNLGIEHVTKKLAKNVLFERYMRIHKLQAFAASANGSTDQVQACDLTRLGDAIGGGIQGVSDEKLAQTIPSEERKSIEAMVEIEAKSMNLSTVRLCFQTYLPDEHGNFVKCLLPVYSNQIYDSKAAAASELKICRMDRQAGFVNGGEEVFLLCDKVQKEDIEVRFFDPNSNVNAGNVWEDFGKFSPTDVHRQFAIVFKTPQYWNTAIEKPVTVQVELRRKSDKETSNPMEFIYKPTDFDPEQIGGKRRKKVPHFGDYGDPGASGAGFGGSFGGSGAGGGGMGFMDQNILSNIFSMISGPSGTGGMTQQSQGQAPPQDTVPAGVSVEGRSVSDKKTKERFMEMFTQTLHQMVVSVKRLEHFSQTSDLRHLLAGHHGQITDPNEDGDSALHIAVLNCHDNIVSSLLDVLPPSSVNQFNNLRQTPLHLAVITEQPNLVTKLLQARADVTLRDRHGNTPLHLASRQHSPACLRSMLVRPSPGIFNERGHQTHPELNMPNYDGLTAVHLAVISGQLENLKILHSMKADMNAQDGKSGFSPLHYAVEADNLNIAGYLILTAEADINIPTIDGNTPLHLSSGHGLKSITALLVAADADTDVINNEDETAVDLATTSEVREVLEGHVGVSLVCSVETSMDNLDILSVTERREFESRLSLINWKLLAKRLHLSRYVAAFGLQENPVKHLLDIYETANGSAQKLRDVLVDMGYENAAQIIDNSLASMNSFPVLPKDPMFSRFEGSLGDADSDYGSLSIRDESLSSFQSSRDIKKGPSRRSFDPSGINADQ